VDLRALIYGEICKGVDAANEIMKKSGAWAGYPQGLEIYRSRPMKIHTDCPECGTKDMLYPPTHDCYCYSCVECGANFDMDLNPHVCDCGPEEE
jgi:hypothetical protein